MTITVASNWRPAGRGSTLDLWTRANSLSQLTSGEYHTGRAGLPAAYASALRSSLERDDDEPAGVLLPDLAVVREDFVQPRVDLQCFPLAFTKDIGNAQSGKGGPSWLVNRIATMNDRLNETHNQGLPQETYIEPIKFQVYSSVKQAIRNNPEDLQYRKGIYTAGLSTLVTSGSTPKMKKCREDAKADRTRQMVTRQVESARAKRLRHVRLEPVYRINIAKLPEQQRNTK